VAVIAVVIAVLVVVFVSFVVVIDLAAVAVPVAFKVLLAVVAGFHPAGTGVAGRVQ
jgi:hypothetical protein